MPIIHNIQLRFHPNELAYPCDKDGTVSSTVFPIYYNEFLYKYNGVSYRGVAYEVHYQYNYAIGFNRISPTSAALGYHEKDTERILILYNIRTDEPFKVFLSAHAQEGRWFNFSEIEKNADGRLIIYVAVDSHRHHNKPATIWRMFGIANDYTSNKGRHIDMKLVQDTSIDEPFWNKEVLDTPFRSFFLPLYTGILPKLKKDQLDYENTINGTK